MNTPFKSVKELRLTIDTWIEHWNDDPTPFIWRKTADEILASVNRARTTLNTVVAKTQTTH